VSVMPNVTALIRPTVRLTRDRLKSQVMPLTMLLQAQTSGIEMTEGAINAPTLASNAVGAVSITA